MQLGIGALSLGLGAGCCSAGCSPASSSARAGGWLVWAVRPHLLAIVAVAGGVAYLVGRVRSERGGFLLSRPSAWSSSRCSSSSPWARAPTYLGLEDLSVNSLEQSLDEQTERTHRAGRSSIPASNSLNPLNCPRGSRRARCARSRGRSRPRSSCSPRSSRCCSSALIVDRGSVRCAASLRTRATHPVPALRAGSSRSCTARRTPRSPTSGCSCDSARWCSPRSCSSSPSIRLPRPPSDAREAAVLVARTLAAAGG